MHLLHQVGFVMVRRGVEAKSAFDRDLDRQAGEPGAGFRIERLPGVAVGLTQPEGRGRAQHPVVIAADMTDLARAQQGDRLGRPERAGGAIAQIDQAIDG